LFRKTTLIEHANDTNKLESGLHQLKIFGKFSQGMETLISVSSRNSMKEELEEFVSGMSIIFP